MIEECPAGSPDNCPIDRRRDDPWRNEMAERINNLSERVEAIHKNTDEIVQFFQTGKGFFRFASWVGIGAKWLATVAAGFLVLWALAKLGVASILDDAGIGKK